MPLIDFYGKLAKSTVTCRHCGWTGKGADMTNGEGFGDGVEKDCPACGERYGFVQWSIAVADNPSKGWKSKIGRVEF
jgi:hypothetical protein